MKLKVILNNHLVFYSSIAANSVDSNIQIIVGSNTNKNDNFLGELVSGVVSGKQIAANGTKIDNSVNSHQSESSLIKGLKIE